MGHPSFVVMMRSKALLLALALVFWSCVVCAKVVKAHEGVAHAPRLSKTTELATSSATLKQEDGSEKIAAAASVKEGSYGKILRTCMNTCGGLCRQLCHKFKHIKVCNGCIRGCNKRCELKEEVLVDFDPAKMQKEFETIFAVSSKPKVGKA